MVQLDDFARGRYEQAMIAATGGRVCITLTGKRARVEWIGGSDPPRHVASALP